MAVDLHCHSTASDGTLSPAALVRLAAQKGLHAIALTDHDTLSGLAEASAEAEAIGIAFLPGIEISASHPEPGQMHLLGLGIDTAAPSLPRMLQTLQEGRGERNLKIIARLNTLGIPATLEALQAQSTGGTIGRPHVAKLLIALGAARDLPDAFARFLAPGGLAYFDKERLSPRQAIEAIRAANGVSVLAHPVHLRTANPAQLEFQIRRLIDFGLDGIEVMHSDHDRVITRQLDALVEKYALFRSGGSDFHGGNKQHISLGRVKGQEVPDAWYDRIARVQPIESVWPVAKRLSIPEAGLFDAC